MTEPPRAREATDADAPALAALLAACVRDPWSAATIAESLRHGARALVLDGPSGLLAAVLLRSAADEVEILQVAVEPASRRLGLGRSLLRAALAMAAAAGAREAFLEVRPTNAPALALYASEFFEPVGLRRAYYADGEDARILRRSLAVPLPPPRPPRA